jgi:hypothetical protein
MNIYEKLANQTVTDQFSERRLWTAVLLQALEDWNSGNRRLSRAAETFLFDGGEDFARACRGAGLSPESVLVRLKPMKSAVAQRRVTMPLAA